MMKHHHTFFHITWLALCMILLGGCVNADMHVTVNMDGSGSYRIQVLSSPLVEKELQPVREKLEQNGYQVEELKKGKQTGWVAEKQVDNVAEEPPNQLMEDFSPEGKSASLLPFMEDMEKGPVKVNAELFRYVIRFQDDLDLRAMASENPVEKAFLNEMNLRFKLTLPLEPKDHNADSVSEDGKTLTWNLAPGEKNPVLVEVEFPNPIGWILVAAGTFLLVVLFVIFWVLRRKRRSKSKR
ncbi:DUF3153 domain-containing protein [Paludifilum halophilum]|uniref:DUF3153 domain-containing protein n=1 Tax=Paludifilum halophilum TaxID=1642702 RepID=A0A235BBU6_9BACL|nr:DUF3153 domain-containing protein [Paludifilum halophilum]OYD09045.1 hypothetical protein CHM34_04550 [Paludifilum halophilum]